MQYTENYEKNFADGGDRAPINDELWEGGWREIVGGVNGYPTSAQFNEVCGRPDRKANELKKIRSIWMVMQKTLKPHFHRPRNGRISNQEKKFQNPSGRLQSGFLTLEAAPGRISQMMIRRRKPEKLQTRGS